MFGKNKKQKKENDKDFLKDDVKMHTMRDDLVSESSNGNEVASEKSEHSDSPFLGANKESEIKADYNQKEKQNESQVNNALLGAKKTAPMSNENDLPFEKKRFSDEKPDKKPFGGEFTREKHSEMIKKRMADNDVVGDAQREKKDFLTLVDKKEELSSKKETIEERLAKMREKTSKVANNRRNFSEKMEKALTEERKKRKKNKLILSIIALLFIVSFAVGGYFAWINKDKINGFLIKEKVDQSENDNDNSNKNNDVDEKKFSDKINVLMIDGELNKENILNGINKKLDDISAGEIFEFNVVDKDNISLLFPEFANALGIGFDSNIAGNLKDDFSLYLSKNASGEKRIALVISVKDKGLLLSSLATAGNNIISFVKPLFLSEEISPEKESSGFNTSVYGDISVRYNNLSESSDLSLDYAIVGDEIMFATSKKTGRLVIGRLLKKEEEKENNSDDMSDDEGAVGEDIILDDNAQ